MQKIFLGLLLLSSPLFGQRIVFQTLQTQVIPATHDHLKAFELLSTPVAQIQQAINTQASNVKYVSIQAGTRQLDLELFEFELLSKDYILHLGTKDG